MNSSTVYWTLSLSQFLFTKLHLLWSACLLLRSSNSEPKLKPLRERESVGLIILSWQRHRWRVVREWTRRVQRRWLLLREQTWLGYASRTSYGSTLTHWTETWCSITLLSHHSTTGLATMSNSACAPFTHSTSLTSRKLPTFLVFYVLFIQFVIVGMCLNLDLIGFVVLEAFFGLFLHMGLLCFFVFRSFECVLNEGVKKCDELGYFDWMGL